MTKLCPHKSCCYYIAINTLDNRYNCKLSINHSKCNMAKLICENARLLDLLRKCRDYICQIPPGSYPRIDEQKHGEFIAEITTALELERGIE